MASELLYCENCGDIIEAPGASAVDPLQRFICEKCLAAGAGELRSGEFSAAASEQSDGAPDAEGLNLFSKGTIAIRKSLLAKAAEDQERDRERDPLHAAGSSRRAKSAAQSTGASGDDGEPLKLLRSGGSSRTPARGAQKIVFRCIHCKTALSIRPVKATSRLTCPYCSGTIFVTASGRLFDRPPSAVLRKGGSQAAPGVRSGDAPPGSPATAGTPSSTKPTSAIVARMPAESSEPQPSRKSVRLRREATPEPARTGSSRSAAQTSAAAPSRPGSTRSGRKAPVAADAQPRAGGGSSRSHGSSRSQSVAPASSRSSGSSRRLESEMESEHLRGARGASPGPADDDFDLLRDEQMLDALDFDEGLPSGGESHPQPAREKSRKPARQARERQSPVAPGGHAEDLRTRGGKVAAFLTKSLWGVFLAATLTLPPLLVSGLRYLALRSEAGMQPARTSSAPALFETFGQIARQGFQKILDSYPRREE
ncbi:MAG: hypothetical protein JXA90_01950 [Planctomycetes bacterium]|nr:hypothetical protein [Planctomycetota bacterium]